MDKKFKKIITSGREDLITNYLMCLDKNIDIAVEISDGLHQKIFNRVDLVIKFNELVGSYIRSDIEYFSKADE